ncbi:MAG: ATP-binding protein [Rikenellaceae bacterium]
MDSTSSKKVIQQRALLTGALLFLLIVVVTMAAVRFWLFHDYDDYGFSEGYSLDDKRIFYANILFVALFAVTIIISILGYVVARLYTSLRVTTEQVAEKHEAALQHEKDKIRIKRQLTNNVNHELKTPICSILGYLEMILGNENLEPDTIRNFAKKSYDQAERLRTLMADLSTITRIEEAPVLIDTEEVDVVALVADIVDDTFPQAEQSRILVVNRVEGDVVVEGNKSLLYSVFRNLIDNSITYSGGRKLYVDLVLNDDLECKFTIQDNGIGIDASHLPYIFERFYRVDTGRSRKEGGTGLGLSIVKNAVIFQGGNIEARASKSGGLEFEFSLKKARPQHTHVSIEDLAE